MIFCKQLDPTTLTAFIVNAVSGAAFSGNIAAYFLQSGWVGPNVVDTTGSSQLSISGQKGFLNSPLVPYSGGTGAAPSAQWVLDNILSQSGFTNTFYMAQLGNETVSGYKIFTGAVGVGIPTQTGHAVPLALVSGMSGAFLTTLSGASGFLGSSITSLSGFTIAMSGALQTLINAGGGGGGAQGSGIFVQITGDQLISGIKTFTGSPQVPAPTLPSGAVNYATLSGVSGVLAAAGGGGGANGTGIFVQLTGTQTISGVKTFTGAVGVGSPVLTGDAVNLGYLTGVSGVLRAVGGSVVNNFSITGTGTINNTFTSSGAMTNTFVDATTSVTQVTATGNFVDGSFYCDPVTTGLNIFETFISHNFFFTGAAFSCRTTGFGPVNGGILSGRLYQVDLNNTEQILFAFTFTSGIIYSGSPTFNTLISGRNRLGLSITNSLSGIEKFCVGYFGGSYA